MVGVEMGRGRIRRILTAVAVTVAAAGTAGAIASPVTAAEGDWRLGYDQSFDSLNPFAAQFTSSYTAFTYLYDWLINIDKTTGGPDRDHSLAASWEPSTDGKVWTYTLRPDLKWSDGEPLTSEDVRWTYDAVLNSENVLSGYLPDVEKVEAVDPLTVRITLGKPNARMTAIAIPILPKHIWGKADLKKINAFDPGVPTVGSGPFQITKLEKKGVTEFEPNANFRESTGAVKRILFIWYGDQAPQLRDIKLGKLDVVLSGDAAWVKQIANDPKLKAWSFPIAGFREIAFNMCPPGGAGACTGPGPKVAVKVVQDPAIRAAIAWGIDRQDIIDTAYSGQGKPGNGIISPAFAAYYKDWSTDPDVGYKYDPDRAKQVLADGGWDCSSAVCTKDGVKASFRLLVRSNKRDDQNASRRIAGWLKDIGIDMKVQVVTEDAINNEIYASGSKPDTYAPTYDAFFWGWGGDVATPDFNFEPLETGSGWTDSFYSNPAYDKVALDSLQEIDPARRVELMHEAEKIALTDNPYIYLVHDNQIQVTNNETWHNYQPVPAETGAPFWNNWIQLTELQPGPAPAETEVVATTPAEGETTGAAAAVDTGEGASTAAAPETGGVATVAAAAPTATTVVQDADGWGTGPVVAVMFASFALGLVGAALIARRGTRDEPLEWPSE